MKKIILLFIAFSMLVCLFGCKKPEEKNNVISDVDNKETPSDTLSVDDNVNLESPRRGGVDSRFFDTIEEMMEFLANGRYLSEKIVDGDGNRYEAFDSIAKALYEGERKFYVPYKNGETFFNTDAHQNIIVYGVPQFVFRVKWTDSNNIVHKVGVKIEYLSDPKLFNTANTHEALTSIYPYALPPGTKGEPYPRTEVKLQIGERTVNAIFTEQFFPRTNTLHLSYEFVINDAYVRVDFSNPEFDIQEFLDGFELRPIDLTKEKIPIE